LNPTVQLLQFLLLTNFPSGSSINFHKDKIYLLGDDARIMIVLDAHYQQVDSIQLFRFPEKRVPKSQKIDIESSIIMGTEGNQSVVALGSSSTPDRKKILVVPLTVKGDIDHTRSVVSNDITAFVERLVDSVMVVNIEGATSMHQNMILANRGNENYRKNFLIVTAINFWTQQEGATINIIPIRVPES
jgi:hypothetical protein